MVWALWDDAELQLCDVAAESVLLSCAVCASVVDRRGLFAAEPAQKLTFSS